MICSELRFYEDMLSLPGVRLPIRCTVVQTAYGVYLLSPTKTAIEAAKTIAQQGPVKALVAPNLFHHLFINKAHKAFPTAKVLGSPGLKEKRPKIPFDLLLPEGLEECQNELKPIFIDGMPKVQETVFLHLPSKTLIVFDLCFNLLEVTGVAAHIFYRLFGTYKKFAASRLFLQFVQDQQKFRRSLEELLSYDFDNIVPAHGDIVVGDGKNKLITAFKERKIIP